jgi:hypothetical protein
MQMIKMELPSENSEDESFSGTRDDALHYRPINSIMNSSLRL